MNMLELVDRKTAKIYIMKCKKFREENTLTIDPVYDDAFDDSDDKNTEAGTVVVHQLQNIHASLENTQIILIK